VVTGSFVEVLRGGAVESRHRVSICAVDGGGAVRAWSGDPSMVVFARSAIKPLQALPLVEDGVVQRLGLTPVELALACASHSGEPRHVEAARSMLAKVGVGEAALACGPHAPFHDASAAALRRAGEVPGRVHNNCSGKHAGMLALARVHGWPLEGYHAPGHPVQQRMKAELARWSGADDDVMLTAVDGCGVVTFGVPLQALAVAFARFAAAARREDAGPAAIVAAMTSHSGMVGGTGRLCTELMGVTGGRVIAKVGAEGVYCAVAPGAELAVALKVEDGARRAAEPALLQALHLLALLTDDDLDLLQPFLHPPVLNTRGEEVGTVRPELALEWQ
jgi:L-asparaginase II